jgi:uncharacterized protein (TIGR03435 family)
MSITHGDGCGLKAGALMVLMLLGSSAIGAPSVVGAQAVAVRPAFDVASIRQVPSPTEDVQAGLFHVGVKIDGSRADYGFMSLAELIPYAYGVKPYQVAGPSWLGDTRWNILAKIPDSQFVARAPEMMQTLLGERFKLALHREKREQAVYALAIARGGLQLREAAGGEEIPSGRLSIKNEGRGMAISGAAAGTMRLTPSPSGGMQMEIAKVTMAGFADVLTQFMDRPVVDTTELKGSYQISLDVPVQAMTGMSFAQKVAAFAGFGSFGARGASVSDSENLSPTIIQAVKRLGLDLQPRKAPVETLVVDHAEKTPTAN